MALKPTLVSAASSSRRLSQLAIQGNYKQVRQLASAELVNAKDEHGRTVLIQSADADWTPQPFAKCVEYFLQLGANPAATDNAGATAAHVAAARNHLRMLALLPFEVKFAARQLSGDTPLMEAVRNASWQCVKHLLHLFRQSRYCARKSELLSRRNRQGQTALDIALAKGHTELAKLIELEQRLVVSGDPDSDTWWSISGLTDSEADTRQELERLARNGDITGLCQAATATNCDLPDADGRTALTWAVCTRVDAWQTQYDATAQLLLDLRADATCADLCGRGCLFWAAGNGRAGAVRSLLAAGAPANAREGRHGQTPLMRAAAWAPRSSIAEAGEALLVGGADWSLRDCEGRTAACLADSSRRSRLAELLRGLDGTSFLDLALELTEDDRKELQRRREAEIDRQRKWSVTV